MRIALVNDYSLHHIGGAVTSMLEQKKALEAAGHYVIVLQLGRESRKQTIDERGIIYIEPTMVMPKSLYNLPFLFSRKKHDDLVTSILSKHTIDVVHTQTEMSLAHVAARAAHTLGLPFFFTVHTMFWEYKGPAAKASAITSQSLFERAFRHKIPNFHPTGNAFEKLLKNITLDIAAQSHTVISPSQHQKEVIEKTDLTTPVVVVPNPYTASDTVAKTVSNKPHELRFAWVGRCVSEKRPLQFLEAIAIASEKSTVPFHVDIIGDGALLETMKAKYPLKNITYHGKKSHEDTVALMDDADVVCMSSYHFDNQPMIIAEAITRYRPVLYCDERLVEGTATAGYLTDNETPAGIAKAIVDLAEHPEKVIALSKEAKKTAALFAPETFVKNIIKLYQS